MSTPEQPTETANLLPDEQNDAPTHPMFRVIIKNPTDRPGNAPFSLSLPPTTTVQSLKQTLSDAYPGKPPTSAQRLIHAGKLLTDAATLASILPPDTDATHTMHLVVSTRTLPTQPSASANQPPVSNPPLQYPANLPPFPLNYLPPNYNPYYGPLHMHPPPYPFPHPPPPSDVPPHPPHPPHLDHQAYAHHLHAVERIIAQALQTLPQNPNDQAQRAQIAAHLNAAVAALHGRPPLYPFTQPNQPPQHPQDHHNHNPEQPNPQPNQPQQDPLPNNALPNNAMGFDFRVHRQNVPRVRHFVFQFELNWSLIAKLAFLLYLLSQEGDTTRVCLLIGTALAAYLWRLGHLRFLRGVFSTALPSPTRFVNMLFPARAPRFARARVALSFAYSFVYGFFLSLLPAWNPERMPDVVRLAEPEQNDPNAQGTPGERQTAGDQPPHEHRD